MRLGRIQIYLVKNYFEAHLYLFIKQSAFYLHYLTHEDCWHFSFFSFLFFFLHIDIFANNLVTFRDEFKLSKKL